MVWVGDEILPSYVQIIVNHYLIRILINQPGFSMESRRVCFAAQMARWRFCWGGWGWVSKWHQENKKQVSCVKQQLKWLASKNMKHIQYGGFKRLGVFNTWWLSQIGGRFATWRIIPVSKCLRTMVSFRPLSVGLWDPFQMAEQWLLFVCDPKHL